MATQTSHADSWCVPQLLLGIVLALTAAFVFNTFSVEGIIGNTDYSEGATIFTNQCSGCHSVETGAPARFGPSLSQIGVVAGSRKTELNTAEYLLESIAWPDAYRAPGADGHMPRGTVANMPTESVRELIRYLANLGTRADPSQIDRLEIDPDSLTTEATVDANLAMLQRGEHLFTTELNCTDCHSIYDEPGASLYAPSLSQASKLSQNYIVESLRKPSAVLSAGYQQIKLILNDGTSLEGLLKHETQKSISIQSTSRSSMPTQQSILLADVAEIERNAVSSMPAYNLSDGDEASLVAFLRFLDAMIGE